MSDSVQPHRRQPTRLPHPWDSPGKNTGVGCHFLLQCMKVKSESEVAQSCPTPSNPMDCSPPGSSVHGIFQARVLEWGDICLLWISGVGDCKYLYSGFPSQNVCYVSWCWVVFESYCKRIFIFLWNKIEKNEMYVIFKLYGTTCMWVNRLPFFSVVSISLRYFCAQ